MSSRRAVHTRYLAWETVIPPKEVPMDHVGLYRQIPEVGGLNSRGLYVVKRAIKMLDRSEPRTEVVVVGSASNPGLMVGFLRDGTVVPFDGGLDVMDNSFREAVKVYEGGVLSFPLEGGRVATLGKFISDLNSVRGSGWLMSANAKEASRSARTETFADLERSMVALVKEIESGSEDLEEEVNECLGHVWGTIGYVAASSEMRTKRKKVKKSEGEEEEKDVGDVLREHGFWKGEGYMGVTRVWCDAVLLCAMGGKVVEAYSAVRLGLHLSKETLRQASAIPLATLAQCLVALPLCISRVMLRKLPDESARPPCLTVTKARLINAFRDAKQHFSSAESAAVSAVVGGAAVQSEDVAMKMLRDMCTCAMSEFSCFALSLLFPPVPKTKVYRPGLPPALRRTHWSNFEMEARNTVYALLPMVNPLVSIKMAPNTSIQWWDMRGRLAPISDGVSKGFSFSKGKMRKILATRSAENPRLEAARAVIRLVCTTCSIINASKNRKMDLPIDSELLSSTRPPFQGSDPITAPPKRARKGLWGDVLSHVPTEAQEDEEDDDEDYVHPQIPQDLPRQPHVQQEEEEDDDEEEDEEEDDEEEEEEDLQEDDDEEDEEEEEPQQKDDAQDDDDDDEEEDDDDDEEEEEDDGDDEEEDDDEED